MLVLNKCAVNKEEKREILREVYKYSDNMMLPLAKLLNIDNFETSYYNTHKTIKALLSDLFYDDNVDFVSCCIYGSTISIDIKTVVKA